MTNPDFRDLLSAFSAAEVKSLLIGGYAVTFHTQPRFTKDLDVWVQPARDNAERVFSALRSFGAPLGEITVDDFTNPEVVYQIGIPPNRVDILTSITAVEFDEAWGRRVSAEYGGVPVSYISREDLIVNKRASGRPRDLLDVADLERSQD